MNTPFLTFARSLLGTPWRHRGRDPRRGLDCIGFVLLVLLSTGWTPLYRAAISRLDYDRTSSSDELLNVLSREGDFISLGNKNCLGEVLQSGDVCVFYFPGHPYPQHVGLVSQIKDGVPYLIHCRATNHKSTSCVVEHALADGWQLALERVYRLPLPGLPLPGVSLQREEVLAEVALDG